MTFNKKNEDNTGDNGFTIDAEEAFYEDPEIYEEPEPKPKEDEEETQENTLTEFFTIAAEFTVAAVALGTITIQVIKTFKQ